MPRKLSFEGVDGHTGEVLPQPSAPTPREKLPKAVQAALTKAEQLADEWEALARAGQEGASENEEAAEVIRTLTGWVRQQAGVTRG